MMLIRCLPLSNSELVSAPWYKALDGSDAARLQLNAPRPPVYLIDLIMYIGSRIHEYSTSLFAEALLHLAA